MSSKALTRGILYQLDPILPFFFLLLSSNFILILLYYIFVFFNEERIRLRERDRVRREKRRRRFIHYHSRINALSQFLRLIFSIRQIFLEQLYKEPSQTCNLVECRFMITLKLTPLQIVTKFGRARSILLIFKLSK